MKERLKNWLPTIKFLQIYENVKWLVGNKEGKGMPHLAKRKILRQYAKQFQTPTLVETGTYLGEMVQSMKNVFQKTYSIELQPNLARKAQQRFSKDLRVEIIQGDSSGVLPELLKKIQTPVLFWLDGHYSGGVTAKGNKETPIIGELVAIFDNRTTKDVILIDDARLFIGKNDYPTIEQVMDLVKARRPEMNFKVDKEIICIYP